MLWVWATGYVIAGLLLGSVLNWLADRMPTGQSLRARPTCAACGRQISALGYLAWLRLLAPGAALHGCGWRYPSRHLLVELATAGLFLLAWMRVGPAWTLLPVGYALCVLVLVFVVDLEHRLVLNRVILPAGVVALLFTGLQRGPLAALVGGAIGLGFFGLAFLLFPRGLGLGDVKMGLFVGLAVGWPEVLPSIVVGVALGGLVPLVLLLLGRVNRRSYVPYATFLAAGAAVGMLYGTEIVRDYFRLYGG